MKQCRLQFGRLCRRALVLSAVATLLLPLFLAPRASATPILTQSNSAQASSTTVSQSFTSTVTAGDLLIIVCGMAASTSSTISVPAGFATAKNESGMPSQGIFYKIATGTESTLTCTFSTSGNSVIQIYEYSGMHTYMSLDAVNTVASTGSGMSFSSGSLTTTHDNDLIFASITIDSGSVIGNWGSSFIAEQANGSTVGKKTSQFYSAGADFISVSAGTYSTTASSTNNTSGNWRGQIVAFRGMSNSPALGADIVDASGVSVVSPAIALSALSFGFGCQTATGTLGTSTQRIRLTNTTDNPAWTLSLAATGGNTSVFSSGTSSYAYNNPAGSGCTGGQLTINVASGTLTPSAGCPSTGVALGSNATYSQGVVDTITLATGSTTAYVDCSWDLTNIPLSQKIPAEQKAGNYSTNFTMTVVAN